MAEQAACIYESEEKRRLIENLRSLGINSSHSQVKFLTHPPLLSMHPVVFFNLFLSVFPFCLPPAPSSDVQSSFFTDSFSLSYFL